MSVMPDLKKLPRFADISGDSRPSLSEIEAYARRMRSAAVAEMLRALAVKLAAAFATSPAVPKRGPDYRDLELDGSYHRSVVIGDAIASAIVWAVRGSEKLVQRFKDLYALESAASELYGLDDRVLHDMGLSRTDIPAAVRGGIYRPEPQPAKAVAANENPNAKIVAIDTTKRSVA